MRSNISKEEVNALEKQAHFNGEVIVVDSDIAVNEAIAFLQQQTVVGFDTETRPSFTRGEVNEVSLLQVATLNRAYLFRVNVVGITDALTHFLENEQVLKIGLSLHDDFRAMRRRKHGLEPKGFVDLQKICPAYGIREQSLRSMYAILFNERMSKQARLTNWEMEKLPEKAIAYAALDAYACLRIYNAIMELAVPPVYRFGLLQ